ncbi:hypothetical protein, partial [Georgenia thermotolerans]
MKYHEGAVAALTDVQRELTGSTPAGQAAPVIGGVRERWVARCAQPAASSPGWQAYRDGGVDALDELAGTLTEPADVPADPAATRPDPDRLDARARRRSPSLLR